MYSLLTYGFKMHSGFKFYHTSEIGEESNVVLHLLFHKLFSDRKSHAFFLLAVVWMNQKNKKKHTISFSFQNPLLIPGPEADIIFGNNFDKNLKI